MRKHRGFTLVELMIALTILGVLTALVIPMVRNSAPSRNKMMMKKAYYTIEDVVRELINNEQYYPEIGASGTYVGFDNTENACSPAPADSTEFTTDPDVERVLDESCSGLYKFPKLFARQLNITDLTAADAEISASPGGSSVQSAGVNFKTSDGMLWNIMGKYYYYNVPDEIKDVDSANIQLVHTITVDVNGDKKPNCYEGETSCEGRVKEYDRFKVYVTQRGKVVPVSGQGWFEDAISIDSSLSGD